MSVLGPATTILLGIIAAGAVAAVVLVAHGDNPDLEDDDATITQLLAGLDDAEPGRGLPRAVDVPQWSIADTIPLATLAGGGAHRALAELAFEQTGDDRDYIPRHALDPDDGAEIPPSMVPALELMTPLERARELVRQLNQARWHPWRHLPRLDAVRYVAATVAARNGVPLLLGTFQRTAVLP